MVPLQPHHLRASRALILAMALALSGCQTLQKRLDQFMFWRSPANAEEQALGVIQDKLSEIKVIYIQSLTGENQEEIKEVLFKEIAAQGYELVDILPDETQEMGVLRMRVENYSIWENEEIPDAVKAGLSEEELANLKILRRNALVAVKIDLFDGETGTPLIRERFSQPFQQIYVGAKDIETRPKNSLELLRLTRILTAKVMRRFQAQEAKQANLELERGENYGWFADEVHDQGDHRLMKGIAFAETGDYEKAILVWKIVLFAPRTQEPDEIYLKNRASAFYNLGQVYHRMGDYLYAAKMFSQANRLQQKLKYAQAWGDNVHAWIDAHKDPNRGAKPLVLRKPEVVVAVQEEKKPNLVEELEKNQNLLLDAKQLWPLEPLVTNLDDPELHGIGKPSPRLYPDYQKDLSQPERVKVYPLSQQLPKQLPNEKPQAAPSPMEGAAPQEGMKLIQPQGP